jgi:hypothetical protein
MNLERSAFLEVIALEEKLRGGNRIQRLRSENGSTVDARRNARVRLANGVPGGRLIVCRFDWWRGAHGMPWCKCEVCMDACATL